jgi:NAD(P)-dependent dehydrogenase (short-subunit alcohol dehydrogenase family)
MSNICEGRVVVVTGAGRGLGREHALEFARQGAKVVVNDTGSSTTGDGRADDVANEVVELIRGAGGEAVANTADVSDWEESASLVETAVDSFGRLDVLVNNAGILRDRMIVSMTEEEWDIVARVTMKGHFAPMHHAARYWRGQVKAGDEVDARIVNTTSGAGLMGSVAQVNYAAAKAGIAAMTIIAAVELAPYGVTANAIAPSARTRLTDGMFGDMMVMPESGFDAMAPENVSPLVVWLGSEGSRGVTGRVFEVEGGQISIADGWQHGPSVDRGELWNPADVGPAVQELLAKAPPPAPVYGTS